MGNISFVFEEGDCIRVDISSSNYPRFDRNLNNGSIDIYNDPTIVVAEQRIYHSQSYQSKIVLPVVPLEK